MELRRVGCGGDVAVARELIAREDGRADVIALDGLPARVRLGPVSRPHSLGADLPTAARVTPVVDGGGVRDALERWAVTLADRAQPGLFAKKRILMVPGFNHVGLAQALGRYGGTIRYADPVTHFNLPDLPGVGRPITLDQAAGPTVDRLREFPFRRLRPEAGRPWHARASGPFAWADILVGDIGTIRRYAPADLSRKTVVVEHATEQDLADSSANGGPRLRSP